MQISKLIDLTMDSTSIIEFAPRLHCSVLYNAVKLNLWADFDFDAS